MQQYDTIEELTLDLALYPDRKLDTLIDCAKRCKYGWFAIAKDGNCALFDSYGNLDDISKVITIDDSMVQKSIQKINLPSSILKIDNGAFSNCTRLSSIEFSESLQRIGYAAFSNCKSLTSLHMPKSLVKIDQTAFAYCNNLEHVTFSNDCDLIEIDNFAFINCSKLTQIDIPDGVTKIGSHVFEQCQSLQEVMMPRHIQAVGLCAFLGCNRLQSVVFKGNAIEAVKHMKNYPWGIEDESTIKCEE